MGNKHITPGVRYQKKLNFAQERADKQKENLESLILQPNDIITLSLEQNGENEEIIVCLGDVENKDITSLKPTSLLYIQLLDAEEAEFELSNGEVKYTILNISRNGALYQFDSLKKEKAGKSLTKKTSIVK